MEAGVGGDGYGVQVTRRCRRDNCIPLVQGGFAIHRDRLQLHLYLQLLGLCRSEHHHLIRSSATLGLVLNQEGIAQEASTVLSASRRHRVVLD